MALWRWVGHGWEGGPWVVAGIAVSFVAAGVQASGLALHRHFNLSLSIDNVFQTHYADPGIRTADGTYYPTQNEQPGRFV